MTIELQRRQVTPAVRGHTAWAFGGIRLDCLHSCGPLSLSPLASDYASPTGAVHEQVLAGSVECAVQSTSDSAPGAGPRLRWQWAGDVATIVSRRLRIRMRRTAPRRYAATGVIGARPEDPDSLAFALATAVVSREGGLVLHAAAVEYQGEAVVFVGPSGAGKTTACQLVESGRWFAVDRAALVPRSGRWLVWPLPGGCGVPGALSRSKASCLPLRCVLSVSRGDRRPRVVDNAPWESVCAIRRNLLPGAADTGEEDAALSAIEHLCQRVPVGRVETVLNAGLSPELDRWLAMQTR